MKNTIYLYGSVGYSWWGEDHFTAASVREQLEGMEGPLTVHINSGGGIATEGQAIYTMLVDYADTVDVVIEGAAMSAASLIAMAGDTITMRLGSFMLIHDPASPWTEGRGTEEDHLRQARQLGVTSNGYAAIYAKKSGQTREAAREIMKAETLYDPESAMAAGFATATDDTAAATAAVFDYRMYANAPRAWREASEGLGTAPSKTAIMAMITGKPRQKQETTMSGNPAEPAQGGGSAPVVAAVPVPAAPAPNAAQIVAQERQRGQRIRAVVMLAGLDEALADELIENATPVDEAVNLVTAKWKEGGSVTKPAVAREPAKIIRDEVDTRRTGMEAAIVAQARRKDPATNMAQPYMQMSLAEMAAMSIGHKGPLRSAGDRIEVFTMAAGHSRSDFPGIFENALNKMLLERYEVQQPTYRRIARKKMFKDFRPHPMVRTGDFPKLQPVGEGGEIKFGTFGEKRETAVLSPYAVGLRIPRQMMVDDDLQAIDDMIGDYGSSIVDFEEETFYAFKAVATLASDGLAVHQTAAHANLAAVGTAITVTALGVGRAAIRKQATIDGKKMNMAPSILLVGPDKETEADQLVTSITPNLPGSVNPFSGRLEVISTAHITGNRWELYVDPNRAGGACFVYGYLDGAEAPRLRSDEPFGQQGMAFSVEHDFGLGAIDFRGTYANPGA